MSPFKTILVPIDFSPGSLAATERAHELAALFGSHVHLLHVVAPQEMRCSPASPFGGEQSSGHEPGSVDALDQLATLVAQHRFDPFTTTGLVRTGRAEHVIGEYADEINADLIVMGVHGDHMQPVGRVVERVLGRTNRAVLAIPAPEMEELCLERLFPSPRCVAC
jgi:nucleotide-binding universal stress UspA family protein